jgi:hypothetical protein
MLQKQRSWAGEMKREGNMNYLMIKQMFDASEKTLEDGFRSLAVFQERTEKMMNGLWSESPLFPETGKKVFRDWFSGSKKSLDEYRENVCRHLKLTESYFLSVANTTEATLHAVCAAKDSVAADAASREPAAQKETAGRKRRTGRKITN